jgi:apolipoprotein D and lipocalin family protein
MSSLFAATGGTVADYQRRWLASLSLILLVLLAGCTGVPDGVEPVSGFDKTRYLGTWHEVARLDHSFERGLTQITAEYSLRDDGDIRVLNSGTNQKTGERDSAEGRAKFVAGDDLAHLKVSFFGPFYGSYVVFQLGENYEYAFVSGPNTDYLWLLARTPQVSEELKTQFIDRARALGFEVENLIWADEAA